MIRHLFPDCIGTILIGACLLVVVLTFFEIVR